MGEPALMSALPESVLWAEEAVCAILITQPETYKAIVSKLSSESFSDPQCRHIFDAALCCHEASTPINALSVMEQLERAGKLANAGGMGYIAELGASRGTAPKNLSHYLSVIRNYAHKQAIARLGDRLAASRDDLSWSPRDLARIAVDRLRPIAAEDASESALLLSASDLKAQEQAQAWAVKSVIPADAVGMFFGASGTYKSFIALDYALHRTYGLPWLGRKTAKGTPVYLAAEGGAGLWRRIEAWHRARGMDPAACPMRVVCVPLTLSTEASRLRDAIEAAQVQPSDIIVDTMSQTFAGEENSSTEVAAYLRTLGAELRAPFKATVLVIHHTGHSATERPRGSSAILANVDFLFGVYRDANEPLATLECVKQKDGDKWSPVSFALTRVPLRKDEDGEEIASLAARHVAGADQIIAAAQSTSGPPSALMRLLTAIGTGAPEDEVRDRFYRAMPESDSDARRQAYYRALKRAEGQGIVLREGDWLMKNPGGGA